VTAPAQTIFKAPYFTSSLTTVKLYYFSQKTLSLPPIKDDQGDQVIITLNNKPSFVTISGTSLTLNPSLEDIGTHNLQIELADANYTQAVNTYKMTIIITN